MTFAPGAVSPAFVITCALVRIVPSPRTTKPEPCAPESPTYVNTVTTPGERAAKICAGEKAEPPSGSAAVRAAASEPALVVAGGAADDHRLGRRAAEQTRGTADPERGGSAEAGEQDGEQRDTHREPL